MDLSSAKSIDGYFRSRAFDAELRLVNLQSELLAFKHDDVIEMAQADLANEAINNLDRLGFVGISENLSADMNALFDLLNLGSNPIISRLNSSPSSRRVDTKRPDIRDTLLKYVQADLRLYKHVIAKRKALSRSNGTFSRLFDFFRGNMQELK